MAEGNVDMQSANENEEELLLSDGANVLEQDPPAPPRDNDHEQRRIRRLNRREREERELARDRRRHQHGRRSPERHRSGSRIRHHVRGQNERRIQRDPVQGNCEDRLPLQRSKLTSNMKFIAYQFNMCLLLQNGAIDVDGWDI